MKQNHDPVEMYGTGTVVAASLVVAFAAVGLVLALQVPVAVVAVGAVALVATSAGRLADRRKRRGRRTRQVCIPDTGVCFEV